MKIEQIKYHSTAFQKVKKDAPKSIIIFDEKADYFCLKNGNEITSIAGVVKYKNGIKLISWFTYSEYRKNGYMYNLLSSIIELYKDVCIYAMCNEHSYKIAEKLNFKQVGFKKFKNFTRRTMVLDKP